MIKRSERGFTLVELAIVILFIGIMAAFILPSLSGSGDSTRIKAIEAVKGYIAEYEADNSTDHAQDIVVINITDKTMFVFGYSYDDDILYMVSGAPWMAEAYNKVQEVQDNEERSPLEYVTNNIIDSAINNVLTEEDAYPGARDLFTCQSNPILNQKADANAPFKEKTLKKMYNNTMFLEAEINKEYENNGYQVAYAEPELVDSSVAIADNTTIFKSGEMTVAEFNSADDEDGRFKCPEDPSKEGEYFLYWALVSVDGTLKNTPATALVPGEEYEIPNSDVVYSAVFTDTDEPEIVDDAYRIYNAAQLKWISENSSTAAIAVADIKIMRSFDASGVSIQPIGSKATPYTGIFNGNGHKIMNLNINGGEMQALFGKLGENAQVNKLTLENPVIKGDRIVGAIAARAENCSIKNCTVLNLQVTCKDIEDGSDREHLYVETTEPEGGTYCGGLVGYGKNIRISGCKVSGEVNGGNSGSVIGGVLGAAVGNVSVSKTSSSATVTGVRYVGGIIGKTVISTEAGAVNNIVITECYNTGTVKRSDTIRDLPTDEADPKYVTESEYCIAYGGIVGGTRTVTNISKCYNSNEAKVESTNTSKYAGGIVGMASAKSLLIEECANYGTVKVKTCVGGILGGLLEATLEIRNSENHNAVEATGNRAGGILGYAKTEKTETGVAESGTVVINGCINGTNSEIKANLRAGGILGDNERKTEIKNSINKGNITETAEMGTSLKTGCGGIVGYTAGKLTIELCENNGDIRSGCQGAGGIVGKATSFEATIPAIEEGEEDKTVVVKSKYTSIQRSSNSGTINNASETPIPEPTATPDPTATPTPAPYTYSGGILGYSDEIVSIDYCYNAGYITGNNKVGGIAGAMVPSKYDADATPTPTPDPDAEVDPEATPTPAQSLIKHSYNVGVVEVDAEKTTGAKTAGAIIGTDEWEIEVYTNFYLENCVQPKNNENVALITASAGGTEYAEEKIAGAFTWDETNEDGVLTLLNADRAAIEPTGETPVELYFKVMAAADGEEVPKYEYSEALKEVVEAYSNDPTNRITLPQRIPVLK